MFTSPRCRGCKVRLFSSPPFFAGRDERTSLLEGWGEGALRAFSLAETPLTRNSSSARISYLSRQAGEVRNRLAPIASLILEFERDVELGAVGFDLALGIQLQIELDDLGHAKIPESFPRPLDRCRGRIFP